MLSTLTIRNLDDALKTRLRLQAAQRGHSMEQEARDILRRALMAPADGPGLAQRIRARFAGLDAHTLAIPERRPARQPELSPAALPDTPGAIVATPAAAGPAPAARTSRRRKA